jgi:hypothetical protein
VSVSHTLARRASWIDSILWKDDLGIKGEKNQTEGGWARCRSAANISALDVRADRVSIRDARHTHDYDIVQHPY